MNPETSPRRIRVSLRTLTLFIVLPLCLFSPGVLRAQSPLPDDFNPDVDGIITAIAVQPDGKVLVGGAFSGLNGEPRQNLGRLNPDGTVDPTFRPEMEGSLGGMVLCLAVQADGKILVGGEFDSLEGEPRNGLGRLNPNGTVDDGFRPLVDEGPGSSSSIDCLIVQTDGKILVAGGFDSLGGLPRVSLGRFNTNGTLDTAFRQDVDGAVFALALQANGMIIVGGGFTLLIPDEDGDLIAYFNLIRVGANGGIDEDFYPDPDGPVLGLAIQPDSRILLSGDFFGFTGVPQAGLARLYGNGDLDLTFAPETDGGVRCLALQTDGKILVGGGFTILGGQPRENLGRLNANGTLDTSFLPQFDGAVGAMAVQRDGRILTGGEFSTVGGQQRAGLARLNNMTPATETLSFAGSTVTWMRGGTSPEVSRVTLDYSTNGSAWTSLNPVTRIAGGWQRGGVSLTGGRVLRARGHVIGGPESTSGWFVETYYGRPLVVSQPASVTNVVGATAVFTATAGGSEPLSYQWLKNGLALSSHANISGVNGTTLILNQVLDADEGAYQLAVSNSFGSVTSVVATLTVLNPYIVGQPASTNRNPGQSATFSVMAAGTPPLSYQWYHDDVAVPGALGASLTLQNLSAADAGAYTVMVIGPQGSITSAPAWLTVNTATVETDFNPGAGGGAFSDVMSIAPQPDGKILVGGSFTRLAGQIRNRLGRLHADGTLDGSFNPGAAGGQFAGVFGFALQPDGRIVVGGAFTNLAGGARSSLGRLNADGTLDAGFNPGTSGGAVGGDEPAVLCLALQPDGKILVGGAFTNLAGQTRMNLARLNTNGTPDLTFNPGAIAGNQSAVYSLAIQPDGKILVGGDFTTLAGQPRSFIGRLNSNGTLDTTFNPGADGPVYTLELQPDGKILAGGLFVYLAGQPSAFVGRLNTNGTFDTAFESYTDGPVSSMVLQTDGRILLGGVFGGVNDQWRDGIARLDANGRLDTRFNPGPGGNVPFVNVLAVQADGKVLVGGGFTSLGGQPRDRLARIDSDGTATQSLERTGSTLSWMRGGANPEISHATFSHSTNGLIWRDLGPVTRIPGGWQKSGVSLPAGATLRARGQVVGGGVSSWSVETLQGPPVLLSQPSGRTNDFGASTGFAARAGGTEPLTYQWYKSGAALTDQGSLVGAGTATLTLNPVAGADAGSYQLVVGNGLGSATSVVATLTVRDPILLGHPAGATRDLGGTVTFTVLATGTPPLSYQWHHDNLPVPGAAGPSLTLQNLSEADIGNYAVTATGPHGSVTSLPAALLVNTATIDPLNNSGAGNTVVSLLPEPDGRILVAGAFTTLDGQSRRRLGRLHADGTLDASFDPGANSWPYCLALQPDGKILVGGAFTNLAGQPRSYLGRLNPDGTADSAFVPVVGGGVSPSIYSLLLQPDGRILAGGTFTNLAGQPRNRLGRLNPDGTLDTTFNAGADNTVYSLALQPDGKILVGGGFTLLSLQSRNRLARLNTNGTLDATFNPGVGGVVDSLALQADGRILVGGSFTNLAGQPRSRLARLNTNGTLDATFNPGTDSTVFSLAVQANGKILLAGSFTNVAGQPRVGVARLHADGTLDTSFLPGADKAVYSLAIQEDGRILIGGLFDTLRGVAHRRIARLNNSDPAIENLNYTGSIVSWTRGGGSPETWRVTFEHSLDGQAWTKLGAGARTAGGWQLTGVTLPAAGTLRARAQASGGVYNGSSWFSESLLGLAPVIQVNLVLNGSNVEVSWNGGQGPYQVQQSTDLRLPGSWQDVGAPVTGNSTSLPIGPGTVFLRVRGQ